MCAPAGPPPTTTSPWPGVPADSSLAPSCQQEDQISRSDGNRRLTGHKIRPHCCEVTVYSERARAGLASVWLRGEVRPERRAKPISDRYHFFLEELPLHSEGGAEREEESSAGSSIRITDVAIRLLNKRLGSWFFFGGWRGGVGEWWGGGLVLLALLRLRQNPTRCQANPARFISSSAQERLCTAFIRSSEPRHTPISLL